MREIQNGSRAKLPGAFRELVSVMPPQAIMNEVHYENTVKLLAARFKVRPDTLLD